jgi:hypothetical protein
MYVLSFVHVCITLSVYVCVYHCGCMYYSLSLCVYMHCSVHVHYSVHALLFASTLYPLAIGMLGTRYSVVLACVLSMSLSLCV